MNDTKKINEQNEQSQVRELSLDEMDAIAGGAGRRNQEESDK